MLLWNLKRILLDPLYKLSIGKSGKVMLFIYQGKMGIPEAILNKARKYMSNKEYDYLLNQRK